MKRILLFIAVAMSFAWQTASAQCNGNAPVINSFSPNTGFIGSTVTITGANFDPTPANNQVFFGATQGTVLTSSFGVITVTVPVGASTAPIAVKNGCNLIAYSSTPFNGIFCPTPLNAATYNNIAFQVGGSIPAGVPGVYGGIYGAYNMLSQDLDNDGKPEVVTSNGGVTVARNTSTPGNLSFTIHNFGGGGSSVSTADFDGDGKKDLFTTGGILRNLSNGPGHIAFQQVGGFGGYQGAVGDFNNDGKTDLVFNSGGTMVFYRNASTGPGNFSFVFSNTVYVQYNCTGIQVADVDGDGKTDVLASQGQGNRAISLRNITATGAANFSFEGYETWPTNGFYPYRCQIADFDKDGKIDLTTCNFNAPSNTAIFRNTSTPGDISFASTVNLVAPNGNYRIQVGDVNGDGYPDIVTKSTNQAIFSVYPNTTTAAGSITFGTRFDYPAAMAEVSGIAIGDLDGDFVPDIATSGTASGSIRIHRNTSAQSDNTPPTASCKNIIVALDPNGSVVVTPQMIDNGSSDACGIGSLLINDAASATFTCNNIGNNSVELKVIDKAGNVSTCTATVTVAPAAIIVAGQTTVCQGQTVTMNANTGDSYQWYNNGVAIQGATSQQYVATVTGDYSVEVTNAGGCSGTSSATSVTVNNNPTVSTSPAGSASLCPPSGTVTISASLSSIYQWKLNGNNIPNATQQTLTVNAAGSYSVQVIDLFGCSATSDPIVVNATDNIAPVAKCKNITVALNSNESASITAADINDGSSDNCSIASISLSGTTDFNCSHVGQTIPVTLVVTDAAGNSSSCVAQVTVTDPQSYCNAAPVAVCQPVTVAAGANCQAMVSATAFNGGSTDADGDQLSYTVSPAGPYSLGVTNVVLTVTDSKGASSNCSTTVTVVDQTAPVANVATLPVITAECAVTVPVPTANDNCSGQVNGTTSDPLTYNSQGTFTITWKYRDASGNESTQTQTVVVKDNTPTVIACPFDIVVNADPGSCGAVVNYNQPSATDNCGNGNLPTSIPGYTYKGTYNGHTYFLSNSATTPENAHAQAIALGGHLATINSAGENSFISAMHPSFIWIGYTDRAVEGTYKWVTNEPVVYTNWNSGEPNNAGGNEDWAVINWGPNGTWNDWYYYENALYVVEFEGGNIPTTLVSGPAPGTVFPIGTTTVTYRATDAGGNTATCSFTVTVRDNQRPVINCPAPQVLSACTNVIGDYRSMANASDNCPNLTITQTPAPGTPIAPGASMVVTLRATDASGLAAACNINVTRRAAISVSGVSTNVSCFNGSNGAIDITVNGGAAPYQFNWSNGSGSEDLGGVGAGTYTVTVTDANGCVFTQSFTIGQPELLVLNGSSVNVTCNGGRDGSITLTASGGVAPYTYAIASGTFTANNQFTGLGAGLYHIAVRDANGCITNGIDVTIAEPAAVVISAQGNTEFCQGGSVKLSLPVTTNTVSFDDLPYSTGNYIPNPYKGFVWTTNYNQYPMAYMTGSSNPGTGYANGTVSPGNIAFNPWGYAQSEIRAENGQPFHYKGAYFTSAWYNQNIRFVGYLSGTVVSSSQWYSLSTGGPQFIELNWSNIDKLEIISTNWQWAMDNFTTGTGLPNPAGQWYVNGNPTGVTTDDFTATQSGVYQFGTNTGCTSNTITVQVNPLPQFTLASQQVTCPGGNDGVITVNATGGSGSYTYSINGGATYQSSNVFSGLTVGTYAVMVKDAKGCSVSGSITLVQQDLVAPVVITKPVTIALDAAGQASLTAAQVDNGSTDNCQIVSRSLDKTSFNCSNVGGNTVTLTVTDSDGNTTSATAMVTVVDNIQPIVVAQPVTIYLDAAGAASTTAAAVNNGSTDNCGVATISLDKTSFDCSNVGNNTVALTVTDVNGNSNTATAIVTVVDNINPTVITQPVTIYLDATGAASTTAAAVNNGSTDNCSIASLSLDKTSFNCSNVGANTVTLTVTDVNGNSSTATAVVTVVDNIAPTLTCATSSYSRLVDHAVCAYEVKGTEFNASATDNCAVSFYTYTLTGATSGSFNTLAGVLFNKGTTSVSVTATDVNGNTSVSCGFTVKIASTLDATISSSSVLPQGVQPNTIYVGYTPASVLTLSANPTGGGAGYTYNWSVSSNLSIVGATNGATVKVTSSTPSSASAYTVTLVVTDVYGCSVTRTWNVSVVDVRCGNKNDKVLVCHKTNSAKNPWVQICIAPQAVATHLANGSTLGSCPTSAPRGGTSEPVVKAIAIKAYPNPTTGVFELQLQHFSKGKVQVQVVDNYGRLILDRPMVVSHPTENTTLDIRKQASGVYLVRVVSEEGVKTLQIVLAK